MDKERITTLAYKHKLNRCIDDYTIGEDENGYMVNVLGSVSLDRIGIKHLPFRFGEVTDNFLINNNDLISLEGCPAIVGGSFNCSGNKLYTLEHAPIYVGMDFWCTYNRIISLENMPLSIGGVIQLEYNNLMSIYGCPKPLEHTSININNRLYDHYFHHLFELGYTPSTIVYNHDTDVDVLYRNWVIQNIIND